MERENERNNGQARHSIGGYNGDIRNGERGLGMGDVADELERRWAEIDAEYDVKKKELDDEFRSEMKHSLIAVLAPLALVGLLVVFAKAVEWVM